MGPRHHTYARQLHLVVQIKRLVPDRPCLKRADSTTARPRGTDYNPRYARNKPIQASVYFSWPLAAKW
jgi:hypothetical protein